MLTQQIALDPAIASFVKSIMIFEDDKPIGEQTTLQFYADGCPGLMFQQTETGLIVNPHKKQMPKLFLYGQTVAPVELVMQGSYKLIGFQLYPFVIKSFFDVTPVQLNDACFDLTAFKDADGIEMPIKLNDEPYTENRIAILTAFLTHVFEQKRARLDLNIKNAIQLIADHDGLLSIKQVCDKLYITERTLERNFLTESGITPKQFSRMMQFQRSLEHLNEKDYTKLSEVVFANGFADQSHFIRVFRSFTGKTPKQYTGGVA